MTVALNAAEIHSVVSATTITSRIPAQRSLPRTNAHSQAAASGLSPDQAKTLATPAVLNLLLSIGGHDVASCGDGQYKGRISLPQKHHKWDREQQGLALGQIL